MSPRKHKTLSIRDVNTPVFKFSTGLAILSHIVGLFLFGSTFSVTYRGSTTYNLLLMFVLMLWNEHKIGTRYVTALLLGFSVGFFVEVLGVNSGVLFGHYTYSEILGLQIFGVPLIIGLNWFKITYCAYITSIILSQYIAKRTDGKIKTVFQTPLVYSIIAALLATFFDYLMEPVANKVGFWHWENNIIPGFNYVCWFLISFFLNRMYDMMKLPYTNGFAIVVLAVQALFFLILNFIV